MDKKLGPLTVMQRFALLKIECASALDPKSDVLAEFRQCLDFASIVIKLNIQI